MRRVRARKGEERSLDEAHPIEEDLGEAGPTKISAIIIGVVKKRYIFADFFHN
jgi:hypothetical protein